MNSNFTAKVRDLCIDLGADLVGISPIERFEGAPIKMSPKGILPTAKCVVVCAIHHPDGAIELGGEAHPQVLGPYSIQYSMNSKLDYIAYRIANFIDSKGYNSIPIASSNIWRYRPFMDLEAVFAPDMSHIYAATCAGLGQLGWHGLTMSPEYGPWNRFISIITEAPLVPDPVYTDIKLCDMCGECIKHCPTDAYRKEVKGTNEIKVEGHSFKFANKNLWRCAWGEHFDLDLDLEIPDVVNEQVLHDTIVKYGKRKGEMGCCVKYCLPKHLRADGKGFTSTYRRKKHTIANDEIPVHRGIYDEVIKFALRYSADDVAFIDKETLDKIDSSYKNVFPMANGACVFQISVDRPDGDLPHEKLLTAHGKGVENFAEVCYKTAANLNLNYSLLDITRVFENNGFESVNVPADNIPEAAELTIKAFEASGLKAKGDYREIGLVLTNARLSNKKYENLQKPLLNPKKTLTDNLSEVIREDLIDNFAFVPKERFDRLADKLSEIKGGEKIFYANDKNTLHIEYNPVITETTRSIHKPDDYLTSSKNVIIFSHHFPDIVAKMALKPPALASGPYVFATYQSEFELALSGMKICKYLNSLGYKAVMTPDLTGFGGDVGSPRGLLNDAICNSLEAVEAGIGALAKNGVCYTKEHGFNQRFMAIVTDAPLDQTLSAASVSDEVENSCKDCNKCMEACPAKAFRKKIVEITLNGRKYEWTPTDTLRCEWAKKHALCGEEGHKYTGSNTDVAVPDIIDAKELEDALKKSDPTLKYRPTTTERCIIDCPLNN